MLVPLAALLTAAEAGGLVVAGVVEVGVDFCTEFQNQLFCHFGVHPFLFKLVGEGCGVQENVLQSPGGQ